LKNKKTFIEQLVEQRIEFDKKIAQLKAEGKNPFKKKKVRQVKPKRGWARYGCKDYGEYLKSDLWASIRARVFSTKGTKCICCDSKADSIHHKSYNRAALDGTKLRNLVPICKKCHEDIEFSDGEKNGLSEANRKLKVKIEEYKKDKCHDYGK
jgi:hypothetical protein